MTAQYSIPNRHGQDGFTLIEVLIAALVLAIGLLGLAGLQAVSLKMSQGSSLRAQATNLAYEIVDSMRANKNNASSYAGTVSVSCNQTLPYSWGSDIASGDLAIWQNRLACLLPSGEGRVDVPCLFRLLTDGSTTTDSCPSPMVDKADCPAPLPSGTENCALSVTPSITVTWDESRLGGLTNQSFSFTTEL